MAREAMKILVVDDECHICEMMEEFLSLIGFTVLTAADGEAAIRMVENQHPQIVFLDIKMPGLGGIQVLERLRAMKTAMGIVMLSAFGDEQTIRAAMDAGADYYLQKPMDFGQVQEIIRTLQQTLTEDRYDANPASG